MEIDPKKLVVPEKVFKVDVKPEIGKIKRVSLEGVTGGRVNRAAYKGNGHWQFPEDLSPKDHIGFIYVIRDMENGFFYIGKKQFKGTGKINKGQESNWPWYISSCTALAEGIKQKGKEYFEYIAIEQYKTKGTLSFAETWSLCTALIPMKSVNSYNTLINKISWRCSEELTERHKERLLLAISGCPV
jgi:hypothetical protein